jgi:hypothetical protein
VAPVIPDDWHGFEITYRHGSATYEISVRRQAGRDAPIVELDGRQLMDGSIPLTDDGALHKVTVWIPRQSVIASLPPAARPSEGAEPALPATNGRAGAVQPLNEHAVSKEEAVS